MNRPSARFVRPVFAAALLAVAIAPSVLARQTGVAVAPEGYTRLAHPTKDKVALQTRSTRFAPANGQGPVVWLVGVAHIGDAAYYKQIQKLLDYQDLVLFERVTRKPAEPQGAGSKEAIPAPTEQTPVYKILSDALGLEYQLTAINYDRPTFRNSDLTWEQMDEIAKKQGMEAQQSLAGIGALLDPNSEQAKMLATVMAQAKNDPGLREGFRLMLAEGLSNADAMMKMAMKGASDVVIISRNDKVFADLQEEINKPKPPRSIAIFYGAGHLADLEKRLTGKLGYKATESRWMPVINAEESKVTGMGKTMLGLFRAQMAAARKGR